MARKADGRSETDKLLEFLAGLAVEPSDSKEPDRLLLASRVGLDADTVGRVFGKSRAAAEKALERARKRQK